MVQKLKSRGDSIVLTENLDTDRVAIGESKTELERPIQRDYFA
jgi:hypothetical protein